MQKTVVSSAATPNERLNCRRLFKAGIMNVLSTAKAQNSRWPGKVRIV